MIPGKSVPGRRDRQCTGSGAESGASKQRGGGDSRGHRGKERRA